MTAAMNPATTHHPFSFGDTPKTTARMAGSVTVKVAIGTMMLRRTSQEDEPRILATTAHQHSRSLLPVSCDGRGRVAQPFGFALTDPSVRLSRTRLFPKVTRVMQREPRERP